MSYLKIKDNVDLKELEKFGYYYRNDDKKYSRAFNRRYIEVYIYNRKIRIYTYDMWKRESGDDWNNYLKNKYIYDLIKADLVEKVEE